MSENLYVRTTMNVAGVGSAIHVAELAEKDAQTCTLLRMIALAPNDSVMGAATPRTSVGSIDIPHSEVPHPDTYSNFPDIFAERVDAETFAGLWNEAMALYGEI